MGSAALYHLARRGQARARARALRRPARARLVARDHADHPPRVLRAPRLRARSLRRAYELWRELEARGRRAAPPRDRDRRGRRADLRRRRFARAPSTTSRTRCSTGARSAAASPRTASRRRWPSCSSPTAASSLPERCIVAHVEGALARTAPCCGRASACSSGTRPRTACACEPIERAVEAERLVLTAGAWSQDVARLPAGLVRGVRQALAWFQPTRPELFAPDRMPVFNLALDGEHFYGFPAYGIPGFKLGRYDHFGAGGDPDAISREPTLARRGAAAGVRRALLPGRRRADPRAQDLPLRALARRALPHRPAPGDASAPSSAPASPDTASSSARSSARSSPTSRSTATRDTTSSSSFALEPIRPECGREDSNLQGPKPNGT